MKSKRFFFLLLFATFFTTITNAQMSADRLKSIALAGFNDLSNHNIDKFISTFADDIVDYGQGPEVLKGKVACGNNLKMFFSAFPNYKLTVEDIAVSGNKVFLRNTFTGTQTGNLMSMIPPTGKMIKWTDTDIFEYNTDGKMVAHWANNPNEPLVQLGYAAFTNPNTRVVLSAYDAFGKGDINAIMALCTDNVVFDVIDRVFLPDGMMYNGKAECANYFKNVSETVMITKFEPYRFLADGDDVVAYIRAEGKIIKTGKMYTVNILHQFKVVNGKITWFKGNSDMPKEIQVMTGK